MKNVVANALTLLPTERNNQPMHEAFLNFRVFEEKSAFLLDIQRIADAQLTDKKCNEYKQHSEFLADRSAYGPQLLKKGAAL